jgi:hypothetical protein
MKDLARGRFLEFSSEDFYFLQQRALRRDLPARSASLSRRFAANLSSLRKVIRRVSKLEFDRADLDDVSVCQACLSLDWEASE